MPTYVHQTYIRFLIHQFSPFLNFLVHYPILPHLFAHIKIPPAVKVTNFLLIIPIIRISTLSGDSSISISLSPLTIGVLLRFTLEMQMKCKWIVNDSQMANIELVGGIFIPSTTFNRSDPFLFAQRCLILFAQRLIHHHIGLLSITNTKAYN